jgi:cell wall-associated NlpC family hydrolase
MKCTFLGFLLVIFLCSFTVESGFRTVIENTENVQLRKRLELFENSGIERAVPVQNAALTGDSLVAIAKTYLNTPHRMGGTSKSGIDCSGLIYTSFKHFGLTLPRSSHEQAKFGKIIASKEDLRKGDLLFFYNSYSSSNLITHTAIYLGNGQFIHTSASAGVEIVTLEQSNYWNDRYLFGTRLTVDEEVIEE